METVSRILWQRLDVPGHEMATLESIDKGWQLSGTALFVHDKRLCKLDYRIICDRSWSTTSAHVVGIVGDVNVDVDVSVDAERRWHAHGTEWPAVRGCIDIDLAFSPSTNLLPIRRLELGVGEEAPVRAAWLTFPSFTLEVLPQVYRREGERTYRYESRGGAFVRTLDVNAAGFVTRYPDLWEEEGRYH